MSPNSEMIVEQEFTPITGIERIGGLSSLTIVEIWLSIESILISISLYRAIIIKHQSVN